MYILIIILIIFIIFLIYFISQQQKTILNNNKNIKDHDNLEYNLLNYKILKNKENKKDNKISEQYNIKTYDIINDNILIHNKYKKELINNKIIKQQENLLKIIENKKKKNKLINDIKSNTNEVIIEDLNKQNIKLNKEITSIKLLLKKEFNDCLIDLKNNKIQKNKLIELINNINKDINNIKNNINNIDNLYKDYNNNNNIISLLKIQKKLYKIKEKFYTIKEKFYTKILSKIN